MNQSQQTNWRQFPLNTFVRNVIDYRGKTPPKSKDGIPLISAANVKNGQVVLDGKFISQEVYGKWTTRGFIKSGDVLITTEAPVAEVAQVPNDRTYLISRRVMALQINKLKANEKFIKYYFLYENTKNKLQQLSHGTTVPRLYKEDILNLEVQFPPLPTQNKIASILSAYDDLIENNTRRIKILETMAQALYQEWFVKFCFPGHEQVKMVESELGLIPEGWEVKELGELIDIKHGYAFKSKFYSKEPTSQILLTPGNFAIGGGYQDKKLKYYDGDVSEEFILDSGDLLVTMTDLSKLGDTLGYPAFVPASKELTYLHNQRLGKVLIKEDSQIGKQLLYYIFCSDSYRHHVLASATGSTVKHTAPKRIQAFKIALPSIEIRNQFESIANSFNSQVACLNLKNINLRKTRDLLLPKLISGQIDVENLDIDTGELAA